MIGGEPQAQAAKPCIETNRVDAFERRAAGAAAMLEEAKKHAAEYLAPSFTDDAAASKKAKTEASKLFKKSARSRSEGPSLLITKLAR